MGLLELISLALLLGASALTRGTTGAVIIPFILASLALLAAGVLAAINIVPFPFGPRRFGVLALWLALAGLALNMLALLVVPAIVSRSAGMVPGTLNALLLLAAPAVLLGNGGLLLGTALLRRRPAAAS